MSAEQGATVAAGVAAVRRRVTEACARAGRDEATITLVGVSKFQPTEAVRAAIAHGVADLGENQAQALRDRRAELGDLPGLRWHMIGALQSNKTGVVAEHAAVFHALDRLAIAERLSRRRLELGLAPLPCFVEVNIAGETTKAGLSPVDVAGFVAEVDALEGVEIVGLMAMPPPAADPDGSRPHFLALAELAERVRLTQLSMGTTGDFEVAIECGATCVRVGRALFGSRH